MRKNLNKKKFFAINLSSKTVSFLLILFCLQNSSSFAINNNSSIRIIEDSHYNSQEALSNNTNSESTSIKKKIINGVAITGLNDVKGKPFYDWGQPFGAFGFPTIGVYNEFGNDSIPIDENTVGSAILASYIDPRFLIVTGATKEDVKPEWVNVPLRNIPVNTDFAFVKKESLKGVMSTEPLELAQTEPSNHITLEQWMDASGVATILCRNTAALVKIRMKNLIPNRMYSVFGTLGLPRDGSATSFFPIPLGGSPNIFVTDVNGDAFYKREMNFCPFEKESTNRTLLTINVQYHADHQNYGAVPEPGFINGLWQGVITFNHVQFPVNVSLLSD